MKFAAGLVIGLCLGWFLATYPGGQDAMVRDLRSLVQTHMPGLPEWKSPPGRPRPRGCKQY